MGISTTANPPHAARPEPPLPDTINLPADTYPVRPNDTRVSVPSHRWTRRHADIVGVLCVYIPPFRRPVFPVETRAGQEPDCPACRWVLPGINLARLKMLTEKERVFGSLPERSAVCRDSSHRSCTACPIREAGRHTSGHRAATTRRVLQGPGLTYARHRRPRARHKH